MDELTRSLTGNNTLVTSAHAASDLLIGLSYVAISTTLLILLIRARGTLIFDWIPVAFGVFIVSCGIGHLLHVALLATLAAAIPFAIVQAVTVASSLATAIALPRVARQIIAAGRDAAVHSETVRVSEARYRRIVEAAPEGIWEVDANFRTTFVNARMAAMLGYTIEELLIQPPSTFIVDGQRAEVDAIRERQRAGTFERVEIRLRRKDGNELWASISSAPQLDADNRFVGSTAMVSDLTDIRRAAEELRESEERYRAVVEKSIDGIVIAQGNTVVYANSAYAALVGLPNPAAVTGTALDAYVVPEQRIELMERAQARQRGEAVPDRYEVAIRRVDGAVRNADVSATIVTHGGRPASLGVLRDVTERVRITAERENLLISERTSRAAASREAAEKSAILDQMTDAVLVVGEDRRVSIANLAAAEFYGLDQAALVGMPVTVERGLNDGEQPWEVFDAAGQVIPNVDRPLARALRGETVADDSKVILADGRVRWSSAMATPLRGSDGGVTGAVLVVRDTTERHVAEERTAQSEKLRLLGQMASGIAHDLNQSLAMVTGYASLIAAILERPTPNLKEARAMLDTVAQAAMDGGSAVQRLLVFTRDRDNSPPERVDLGELLRQVANLTAPRWRDAAQADGRPITLTIVADPGAVAVGHPTLLRQALTNLVINAADALPEGGSIRLTARTLGDTVEIAVADSGIGMPAEVQRRAFEPFYSTKGDRGTGLGLAQVATIAEKHGGRANLRSTPGQGTTVALILPTAQNRTGETDAPVATVSVLPTALAHVLVVDDEPRLALMAALVLRSRGHAATTAMSGEEALEHLATGSYDLVASDLSMGAGMNGWDLADQVRLRWPTTRVILLTGWGASIDLAQARARGVTGVLAKPYDVADLLKMVETVRTPIVD